MEFKGIPWQLRKQNFIHLFGLAVMSCVAGMDASQYKDYVLTMLFMKYVSDKFKGDPYGMIVVPNGASYDDMVAAKGDKEIGDKINTY